VNGPLVSTDYIGGTPTPWALWLMLAGALAIVVAAALRLRHQQALARKR
jgi:hypothetical protein